MKRSILLAGSPDTELGEVHQELAQLAPDWEFLLVGSGLEALDLLTRRTCHAIVADLRLPDLTGLQLLGRVLHQWPQMHRVILADLGALDSLLRCVGGIHQFLVRPYEAQRIHVVLERAFSSEVWLSSAAARPLLGKLPRVPSPPGEYHTTISLLEKGLLGEAAEIIASDPPMCAKTLQLANSAACGPVLDEADPINAVKELGLTNIRRTLLLAHSYSNFRDLDAQQFPVADLWDHARQTSQLARRIAESEGAGPDLVAQCATAGMLHDLGKVVLAANLPEQCNRLMSLIQGARFSVWEAEMEVFGATHCEVGGTLLQLWGLPMPIVEAVALQRYPARLLSDTFSPLTAIHVANALRTAEDLRTARERLDLDYLNELGLLSRIPAWFQLRQEPG